MLSSRALRRLTVCSLATAMCGAGQGTLAHTVIKDAATEGKTLYTAAVITHGCGFGQNPTLPVVAMSVLFPNNADSVWTRLDTNAAIQQSDVIEGAVFGLAPNLIQEKSVFQQMKETADPSTLIGPHSTPNVRKFKFTKGNLQTDLVGLVPFSVSGVNFVPTSCAKSLKVRIAIVNWCTPSQDPNDNRRVDVWIGHMTQLFNDPDVMPEGFQTSPFWPTLTVNRDLVANPLPSACGAGYDAAVEPSEADIDTRLGIQGYWPKP